MQKQRFFKGLTRDTFLLAATSFFSDVSTEMLYPLLPIFLTQVLKSPATIVGIVEGIAEGVQYTIQGFSGYIADKLKNRKRVALVGYALTALSKPFIGISTSWQHVLAGRFSDRLGAGIRSAPRDALIAASADDKSRGKAFGLEGVGDNAGAVFGPLIAIVLLYYLRVPLRAIFYLAFIPGFIAFTLVFLVKEKKSPVVSKNNITFSLTRFPKKFWKYMGVIALFGIGNSSNAFLILRAKDIGIPVITTIFIYAAYNLTAALSSYPAGNLSDRWGRKNILILSFLIFVAVYFGFAKSTNIVLIAFLFILYGIFQGIFRAVGKSQAVDLIPADLRATGIGIYSTVYGVTTLFASIVGGQLWDKINPSTTFLYGVATSITATLFLIYNNV